MTSKKKNAVFDVYASVVGSKYLGKFEARSEEEAVQKALKSAAASISLCHQCADEVSDPEIDKATAVKRDEGIEEKE